MDGDLPRADSDQHCGEGLEVVDELAELVWLENVVGRSGELVGECFDPFLGLPADVGEPAVGADEAASPHPSTTDVSWARGRCETRPKRSAGGLDTLDSLDVTLLEDYQPYHAARADLLARAGRRDATAAYDRAIELTTNPTERRFLERQRTTAADRT